LDDDPLVERAAAAPVDEAGDARTDRRAAGVVLVPPADAVHRCIAVECESERVPVAAEARADAIGHREPVRLRSEEDLRRAEGATGEHDDVAAHRELVLAEPAAPRAEEVVAHGPRVAGPFDPTHVDTGHDV